MVLPVGRRVNMQISSREGRGTCSDGSEDLYEMLKSGDNTGGGGG